MKCFKILYLLFVGKSFITLLREKKIMFITNFSIKTSSSSIVKSSVAGLLYCGELVIILRFYYLLTFHIVHSDISLIHMKSTYKFKFPLIKTKSAYSSFFS